MFESCLKEPLSKYLNCGAACEVHTTPTGTTVDMKAECLYCSFSWNGNSQPMNGRMPPRNLIFSAVILFSRSSPSKVFQSFKHPGTQFLSAKGYNLNQSAYLLPSVRNVWNRQKQRLLASFQGRQVTLGGDGRCDTPGYCAKYGSYSCMDL